VAKKGTPNRTAARNRRLNLGTEKAWKKKKGDLVPRQKKGNRRRVSKPGRRQRGREGMTQKKKGQAQTIKDNAPQSGHGKKTKAEFLEEGAPGRTEGARSSKEKKKKKPKPRHVNLISRIKKKIRRGAK